MARNCPLKSQDYKKRINNNKRHHAHIAEDEDDEEEEEGPRWKQAWEEYIQEEARVANREDLLKEDDQALTTHTKRIKK